MVLIWCVKCVSCLISGQHPLVNSHYVLLLLGTCLCYPQIFAVNLKTKNQNPKSEFPNSKSGVPNFKVLKSKIEIGNPKSKTKSKPPTNTQDTGNPKSEIQNLEYKIQTPTDPRQKNWNKTSQNSKTQAKSLEFRIRIGFWMLGLSRRMKQFGCLWGFDFGGTPESPTASNWWV